MERKRQMWALTGGSGFVLFLVGGGLLTAGSGSSGPGLALMGLGATLVLGTAWWVMRGMQAGVRVLDPDGGSHRPFEDDDV